MKIAVFGGGSWATALGYVAAKKQHAVTMLVRDPLLVDSINEQHVNYKYQSSYTLPANIRATLSPEEAIEGADFFIHAVPVQHTSNFIKNILPLIEEKTPLVNASKGLEIATSRPIFQVLEELLGPKKCPVLHLSGPSFAAEVLQDKVTAVELATRKLKPAIQVQEALASQTFQILITKEVSTVSYGGALKNIMAIAVGIAEGYQCGINTISALFTAGMQDLQTIYKTLGISVEGLIGLSGIGDLWLTCNSNLSKNKRFGLSIGQGMSLEQALKEVGGVVEGRHTLKAVMQFAQQHQLKLPVIEMIDDVLEGSSSIENLMQTIDFTNS